MNKISYFLIGTALLTGCGGSEPSAVISVSPNRGAAPLTVTFDASASSDPDHPGATISARFDFDGNGAWDTEASTELVQTYLYDAPGKFEAAIEILSVEGRSKVATVTIEVLENQAPIAVISASPTMGRAPLEVTIDASATTDPDEAAETLLARFDFDGDGTFDTELSTEKVVTHTFQVGGQFRPSVEIVDRAGATSIATLKDPINVTFGADLDVDTNRDGVINDADDDAEDIWSATSGAPFLANLDDDDFDQRPDGLDDTFEGREDIKDLAKLVVRIAPQLTAQDTVTIEVTPPEAAANVRIWGTDGAALRVIHRPGPSQKNTISPTSVALSDLTLLIEAKSGRSPSWDGHMTVTLEMNVGGETLTDVVAMRVSPVVFTDNLQTAERLFVMRIDDNRLGPNLEFYNQLDAELADDIELYTADQYEYLGDRWLQDNMQTGYQSMPGPDGAHVMRTHLETQRPTGPQGLEFFLSQELLGADLGYAYPGRSRDTSLNYGGNLEVAPPHEGYPLGRLVAGGGFGGTLDGRPYSDSMSEGQTAWLNAQEIQGPMIEVSSEWLAVGHIDEIFLFVPNLNAAEGERPWKVVIASPHLGVQILEDVQANGGGRLRVFAGRQTQTTVSTILNDATLMDYQDAAQSRIDSVREVLVQTLGLTDEDFVEVPVLYEWYVFDGFSFAAAYNPGIQNLIVANEVVFVPDPEGPVVDGVDALRDSADRSLRALGLTPKFVDVFDSYHLNLGEAHCGTEMEGAPYAEPWWTAAAEQERRQ